MKGKSVFAAAFAVCVLSHAAWGEFVAGHVFVSEPSPKNCNNPEFFGSDRIWKIDPETGAVTLFRELSPEECGGIAGLVFTPDGTRLRASLTLSDQIVEFDSDGNMTVVLDSEDGVFASSGANNIAYDANGNFYVVGSSQIEGSRIVRIPRGGGSPTVFADESDGILPGGAIAFAADGDLYYAPGGCTIVRITPDGEGFEFDDQCAQSVTADRTGNLYVGKTNGVILRYDAGDPSSIQDFATAGQSLWTVTMSNDMSRIYVARRFELVAIDTVTRTRTVIAEISEVQTGIAVAPGERLIPTLSGWGLAVLACLLIMTATLCIRRYRVHPIAQAGVHLDSALGRAVP